MVWVEVVLKESSEKSIQSVITMRSVIILLERSSMKIYIVNNQWNVLTNGQTVSLNEWGPKLFLIARFKELFKVRGSSIEVDGTVKKCSFWIILELIPLLNSLTCFWIYLRKASLDHRPRSIIVKTGTWANYIAMAAPLWAEWRPISFAVNPKESGPKVVAAWQIRFNNSVPVKKCFLPSVKWNRFTESEAEDPG